ncbi:hypothetical protein B0H13DRAFT_2380255 [Mycena leptocephala]|nr:hypothetical protein B0H13DRAFT_2380255 [Mycena leptocephala]
MFKLQLLTALFIGASAIQGASISAPEAIVPLPIAGSMAMVQNFITIPGASDTRVFFQNSDNSISQVLTSGSLNVGKFESQNVLVPAAQVAKGTPIAAFSNSGFSEVFMLPLRLDMGADARLLYQPVWKQRLDERPYSTPKIHVYFFSPANTLSEYIWQNGIGWQGGSTCTKCVDVFKFAVVSGSTALYAVSSGNATSTAATRVGFINAGSPTTLTEAIWNPSTNWFLAGLQE